MSKIHDRAVEARAERLRFDAALARFTELTRMVSLDKDSLRLGVAEIERLNDLLAMLGGAPFTPRDLTEYFLNLYEDEDFNALGDRVLTNIADEYRDEDADRGDR